MLLLSDPKEGFKARSPFSPRDDLLGSSSPGEALILSVNNYSLTYSKRGKKKDELTRSLGDGGTCGGSGLLTPALMNIELFICH